MTTNKQIIIAALSDWGGKTKEQIANTILFKLQTLDGGEVEKIIFNLLRHPWANNEPKTLKEQIGRVVDQILQLIPEEGEVIFKGKWIGYSGQLSKYLNKNIILTVKVDKDE